MQGADQQGDTYFDSDILELVLNLLGYVRGILGRPAWQGIMSERDTKN